MPGTLAQVRWHITQIVRLAYVFDLAPPAGFEPAHTAPECNPSYRRYQRERGLGCLLAGAYGACEILVLSFASAAINSHDPEGIRCTNDHTYEPD
jgi:hypothetical protein